MGMNFACALLCTGLSANVQGLICAGHSMGWALFVAHELGSAWAELSMGSSGNGMRSDSLGMGRSELCAGLGI
jgi:hypothetical protein